jgi:hypothetical protein
LWLRKLQTTDHVWNETKPAPLKVQRVFSFLFNELKLAFAEENPCHSDFGNGAGTQSSHSVKKHACRGIELFQHDACEVHQQGKCDPAPKVGQQVVPIGPVVGNCRRSLIQLLYAGIAKQPVKEKVAKQHAVLEAGHAETPVDGFSMQRLQQ